MSNTNSLVVERERRLRRACAELRARLRAHLPCSVEDILAANAEVDRDPEALLELIYTEWTTREDLGEHPQQEDVLRRFPRLADRLKRLFAIHAGIVDPLVDNVSDERPNSLP